MAAMTQILMFEVIRKGTYLHTGGVLFERTEALPWWQNQEWTGFCNGVSARTHPPQRVLEDGRYTENSARTSLKAHRIGTIAFRTITSLR